MTVHLVNVHVHFSLRFVLRVFFFLVSSSLGLIFRCRYKMPQHHFYKVLNSDCVRHISFPHSVVTSFRFGDDLSSFSLCYVHNRRDMLSTTTPGWCFHCNVSSKCEKKNADIYIKTNKKCARKYEMSRKAAQQQYSRKEREKRELFM